MCYNCGCGMPDDQMGHPENITNSTLKALAKKWGKSFDETKQMVLKAIEDKKIDDNPDLKEMFEKAAKAWGQSVEEAEKNARDLLEQELG